MPTIKADLDQLFAQACGGPISAKVKRICKNTQLWERVPVLADLPGEDGMAGELVAEWDGDQEIQVVGGWRKFGRKQR